MSHAVIAVPFHSQTLTAALINGIPHVAMKPICENIGLNWASQFSRIKRHPVMSKGVVMMATPSNSGIQEMLMLPLKMLNGWLFGVDSNRVAPEIKDRVIEYQEECFDVLANHFMPKQIEQPKPKHATAKEKLQLRIAIEQHCAKSGDSHRAVWLKLNKAYHVNTIELLPTGKVPEMLAYLGLRVPELDEMVLVPQRQLLALQNQKQLPPPQQVIGFTQAEVNIQIAEAIKGVLVDSHSSATITISTSHDVPFKRTLVTECRGVVTVWELPEDVKIHTVAEFQQIIEMGFILIDKNRLDEITLKQLGKFLA